MGAAVEFKDTKTRLTIISEAEDWKCLWLFPLNGALEILSDLSSSTGDTLPSPVKIAVTDLRLSGVTQDVQITDNSAAVIQGQGTDGREFPRDTEFNSGQSPILRQFHIGPDTTGQDKWRTIQTAQSYSLKYWRGTFGIAGAEIESTGWMKDHSRMKANVGLTLCFPWKRTRRTKARHFFLNLRVAVEMRCTQE